MLWEPRARVLVVRVATPPEREAVPTDLLPERKVTVPVGVGPVPETVAVRETGHPSVADGDEVWTLTVDDNCTVKECVTGGAAA
jgi:hypothetical protein